MKIIIIVMTLLMLSSCTSGTNEPTVSNTAETDITITDSTISVSNLKLRPYRNYDEVGDNSFSAGKIDKSITSTENTNSTVFTIEDGVVVLYDKEGERIGIVEDVPYTNLIAWHTNCGGVDYFTLLHSDGRFTSFRFELLMDENEKTHLEILDLATNSFKEKVIDLIIYDDTSPFTTCGGATFYYILEDGRVVNYSSIEREEARPYTSFFESYNEDEGILNILYLYRDGTLHLSSYDYKEAIEDTVIEDALTYDDKIIVYDEVYEDQNSNDIYIIDNEDVLYKLSDYKELSVIDIDIEDFYNANEFIIY